MPDEGFAILGVLAAAALVVALWFAWPMLVPEDPIARRIARIGSATADRSAKRGGRRGGKARSVKDALAEIEDAQRKRRRLSVRLMLRQAGLDWSREAFLGASVGLGIAAALLVWLVGLGLLTALLLGIAAGLGLPQIVLRFLRARRLKRMVAEFPTAIDVIVRGVKSGLPFPDCLRIIANEAREPLKSEFAKVVRDQTVGLPVDEAVQKMADRVPLPEVNFFAIVITIQKRTGGSLSESLGNLSTVLRERKKMRGKVKAMSAEAKASGGIIGALPVVVSFVVYLTSPDYIMLLFDTTIGNVVIAGCLLWMGIGVLVMRNMISFEI